jgi:hypothetical protein
MTCRKCGIKGRPGQFKRDTRIKCGRENICRPCDYKKAKAWRAKNQERTREQLAEQYWRDPEKQRKRHQRQYKTMPKEYLYAIRDECRRRMRRGQAHWQRTSQGVLIGRLATPKKDRTYIKERLTDD